MIVDASAIVAFVMKEAGSGIYGPYLFSDTVPLFISAVNWWEVQARIIRHDKPDATRSLQFFQRGTRMELVAVDRGQTNIAIDAFRRFGKGRGHPAGLNLGDCFAYALAKTRNEPLLFNGDDFRHTDVRAAL
ncbi:MULTISPECIES: type II toxin-antitoxin system VapC family toxin [unclassified Roseitalea]|uniref:type II toxin-antitoxin system VapC family toxin n=1 Tax=unclassified Roseitalea TaxID=2639107 RepID=UPI0027400382|nr:MULTISPECIES: type II toxin-antitoxin system VapC family toxin [unclassified Roseitalea]